MARPYLNEREAKARYAEELKEPGTDCCQAQTPAPKEVPARESLLNWIRAIEADLVRQLTRLQQAREVIDFADDHTLRIVKQLVELDFQRRF